MPVNHFNDARSHCQALTTWEDHVPAPVERTADVCPLCGGALYLEEHTIGRDGELTLFCPRCGFEVELPPDPPRVLVEALRYAGMGYPVLPLSPGDKTPHPLLGGRGFTAADTSALVISARFESRPDANLGIVPPDGVVAFDFDDRGELRAFLRRFPSLTRAPRSYTPRGAHLWAAVPKGIRLRSKSTELLPRFELKRPWKGYVVESPSIVGGVPYVWDIPLKPPEELPLVPQHLLNALKIQDRPNNLTSPGDRRVFERIVSRFKQKAIPRNRHPAMVEAVSRLVSLDAPPEYIELVKEIALERGLPTKEANDIIHWAMENIKPRGGDDK